MNQYLYVQNDAGELRAFPHILEFASQKIQVVKLHSLEVSKSEQLRIYFIVDGKFEWEINGRYHVLYPGDIALVRPGQQFGSRKGFFDLGSIVWISLEARRPTSSGDIMPGAWSSLSLPENQLITKILNYNDNPVVSHFKKGGEIFQQLQLEISLQELGYKTRVNHLLDEMLISVLRQLPKEDIRKKSFPQSFLQLEQTLRENLSYQWTVEEMAATMRLGLSAFTEKVKDYTGFSPINHLINIRISASIRLLKQTDLNLTDVALETGFYSSQHFSTTFKKITGYTPSQFKQNNTRNSTIQLPME